MSGAGHWRGALSPEARPPRAAAAHCKDCGWFSGLVYVDGDFVCSDPETCARRQRGEIDDDWEGYDADLER